MKIGKRRYVLGSLMVIFSVVLISFFVKTSDLKAKETDGTTVDSSNYVFNTNTDSDSKEFSANLEIISSEKEDLLLEVNGENDGYLLSENLQEQLPEEYQEKIEFSDKEPGKSVVAKIKVAGEKLDIPVTFSKLTDGDTSKREVTVTHVASKTLLGSLDFTPIKEEQKSEAATPVVASQQISPYGISDAVPVTTWDEFLDALQGSATDIRLMNNVSRGTSSRAPGTLTRSVNIYGTNDAGANYTLDMGAQTGTSFRITLGSAPAGSVLRFEDIVLKGTGTGTALGDSMVYSAGNDSANWTVALNDFSLAPDNTKRIAYVLNGAILVDGGINEISTSVSTAADTGGFTSIATNWHRLFETKSMTVTNGAKITGKIQDMLFASSVAGAQLVVDKGSVLDIDNEKTPIIAINGNGAQMLFSNSGTEVLFNSNTKYTDRFGGAMCVQGTDALIDVSDGALFDLYGAYRPVSVLQGNGATFNIRGKSTFNAVLDDDTVVSNAYGAVMRFRTSDDVTFNISDHSVFSLVKNKSTRSEALRLSGSRNTVAVSGGSKFFVENKGNMQGLQFDSGSGQTFSLTDKDSKVEIISAGNVGLMADGAGNDVKIIGGQGTEFTVDGYGSGNAAFNYGNGSRFEFNNMLYYDFRNNGGGAVFDGGNTSSAANGATLLKNHYSDVSVWKKGSNLEGNPFKAWTLVDMGLWYTNFQRTIHSSQTIKTFTMDLLALPGTYTTNDDVNSILGVTANNMTTMSRVSGNNANPIVDELRQPTNADKYAFGHVTIPEGVEGSRDAWTDEVTVILEVTPADGSAPYEINGKTVGNDGTNNGLPIYDEAARAGMFQAENKNGAFFKEGDKVKVLRAWRGGAAGDLNPDPSTVHIGYPTDTVPGSLKPWVTNTEVAIDVTPPTQAVSSTDLTNATKQITGTSDEDGAKVFVKVDGEWLKDNDGNIISTTVASGKWTINLPAYVEKNAVVDIYLKDKTVLTPEPAFTLPVTYTQEPDGVYGNINENPSTYDTYAGYHDAVKDDAVDNRFDEALRFKPTKDVIPDKPSLDKSVESSGGTTTSVGDILTYTLVVGNDKADSEDWKNVVVEDVLKEGLTFDGSKHKVTINGTEVGTDKYDYNTTTRTLTFNVGDISYIANADQKLKITFQVTVDQSAVDKDITNKATAKGDSPQEDPFVAGPVNPDTTHKVITKESDEVGLPGGPAFGVLQFVSAPTSLDFGIKTEKLSEDTTATNPTVVGKPMVVSDNRGTLKSWTLYATLEDPLRSQDDNTIFFPDAVRYKNGSTTEIITGAAKPIVIHTNDDVGEYDITEEEWNKKGNGFELVIPAGAVNQLGKYQAKLVFTLADTK